MTANVTYECDVEVMLPGESKLRTMKMTVEADSIPSASALAEDAWRSIEPIGIRARKVSEQKVEHKKNPSNIIEE